MTTAGPRTELDDPQVANLVARGRQLAAAIAPLADQLDEIKKQLRTILAAGTWQIDGQDAVAVTASATWSADKARELLTAEQLAACTVEKLDATTAKQVLSPAIYEACSVPRNPSVSFK